MNRTLASTLAVGLAAFLVVVIVSRDAWAPLADPVVPVQGLLTDADGIPITGAHDLTFNVYDGSGGGASLVWSETYTSVAVTAGLFTIQLGDTTGGGQSIQGVFDPVAARYLGVQVDGGTELTPRMRFGESSGALLAQDAQTLQGLAPSDVALAAHNHAGVYAASSHTHSGYASSTHNHDILYAAVSHSHSNYALTSHTHSGYASSSHTHSNYALTSHTHSGYASASHNHFGTYANANQTCGGGTHVYGINSSGTILCN